MRWQLRCQHPDDQVELGPPDRHHYHVAYCRKCHERWAWYDTTVSQGYLDTMRELKHDPEFIARIERANVIYREKRARYEDRGPHGVN